MSRIEQSVWRVQQIRRYVLKLPMTNQTNDEQRNEIKQHTPPFDGKFGSRVFGFSWYLFIVEIFVSFSFISVLLQLLFCFSNISSTYHQVVSDGERRTVCFVGVCFDFWCYLVLALVVSIYMYIIHIHTYVYFVCMYCCYKNSFIVFTHKQ